jgi:hypothetical protein
LQVPVQVRAYLGLSDTDHRDGLTARARLAHTPDSSVPGEPGPGCSRLSKDPGRPQRPMSVNAAIHLDATITENWSDRVKQSHPVAA